MNRIPNTYRFRFLCLSLLAFWITTFAVIQNGFAKDAEETPSKIKLTGKVLDKDSGTPLTGALISIPDLQIGTEADKNGEFELEIFKSGKYHLNCQLLGYHEINRSIDISEDFEITFFLKENPIELQGVDVTDQRNKALEIPQSLTVLDQPTLLATRGQTLGEMLKNVPGVTVLQTGPSISKPVIRGLHSDRILIVNTGVTQEGQQWGGEQAPEIDPFAPERIEILRGAAGVEYGSNAIGGVIRLEPRELRRTPGIGGKLSGNLFSNNRQGAASLLLEGGYGPIPGLGWRLQGSFRKAGDSQTPDFIIRNSAFEERDWSGGIGYNKEYFGIDLNYSYFDTELGIYRDSHISSLTDLENTIARGRPLIDADFTYSIGPPRQEVTHQLLSIHSHYELPQAGSFEIQYGWQRNHRREFDAHRPFSSEPPTRPGFDMVLTTYSLDASFKHNPISNIFGKIGLSGTRQGNARRSTGFLIPNFRAYSFGGYWIENWSKGALTVNAGTRFDYRWLKVFPESTKNIVERVHEYTNVSGVGGLVYQLSDAWSIGTNIGTAWRPPNVNELYSDGVHHGTAQYEKGNPDFVTEKSLNVDATVHYHGANGELQFSVYNNFIDDYIYLFPEAGGILTVRGAFPAFSYRQTDAVLRGIDGKFEYRLTSFYKIGASATIVRGDNRQTDEPLIFMPADRFRLMNEFPMPSLGLFENARLEISANFVRRQDRFPEGDFTEPPPGYTLFNIDYNSQIKIGSVPLTMSLSIANLFDTAYRDYLSRFRYFIDDPGRNVVLRLQVPFGDFK